MSQNTDYKNTISKITKDEIDKKKDEELVLRFLTLKNNLENYFHPFDEYLTAYMEGIAKESISFNYEKEKENFDKTFMIVNKILDSNIFSTKRMSGKYQSNFVLYYYDGLILGIQNYIDTIIKHNDYISLIALFEEIKDSDILYKARTGSKSNIKIRIKLVEEKLENFFNDN